MKIIVFLGPPGSGKGTQAARLSQHSGLVHLSTGDLLRTAVKDGSDLGHAADGFMKRGELVPDVILIGLVEHQIAQNLSAAGFIFDGFPRTIPQADGLKQMLKRNGRSVSAAILFKVDSEEVVRRLSARWSCPACGAIYTVIGDNGSISMCEKDSSALTRRHDDDPAVVQNRLAVYEEQTKPIENYYRVESVLREIDAQQTPEEVFKALLQALL
ncbi:MAG: adenylate kinase [Candidatus Zixiibacteriota bacterium]